MPSCELLRIDAHSAPRNLIPVLHRFCLLAVFLALSIPLRAQNDPVKMTPEFCFTFPLAQNGTEVTVKYPVLVNPTVVKPGDILRVMYILHNANANGSSDLVLAHKGNMENSFSRTAPLTDGQTKLPPELAHEIEGYRRTIWEVPNNFVLAMAQYPTDAMHLIYAPGGNNLALRDEIFSFFDGLLVGMPDGKSVTVLAVETDSHADHAGLKAGDEIVAVGGIPTQGDLAKFASGYAATKKAAHENETSSYSMTIRADGKGDAHNIDIGMPPSLKGGLMDGFK